MPKKIHRRRDADPDEGLEKYGDATVGSKPPGRTFTSR